MNKLSTYKNAFLSNGLLQNRLNWFQIDFADVGLAKRRDMSRRIQLGPLHDRKVSVGIQALAGERASWWSQEKVWRDLAWQIKT